MSISLTQILDLVGKLDDTPGDDTPRERFRHFLKTNIAEVGALRDYVESCLRLKGDNYNRALQDLVNYAGRFLDFEVAFGRYSGVVNRLASMATGNRPPASTSSSRSRLPRPSAWISQRWWATWMP